jgi:hypothetical protein
VTRTRTVITALSCLSVLALGACSDEDPEPKFAPTPSTSAPTSPSTTAASGPTEPTMPAAAQGHDQAAARAFVRYWLDTLNYAIESGDSDSLRAVSASDCKACERVAQTIDAVYSKGGSMSGGTWSLTSLRPLPLDRGADWAGYVSARISAQSVTGVEGAEDQTYAPGPGYMYTYVADRPDGWQMVFMDIPV